MTKKFNDIIIHYGKEVEKMEAIFNAFKDKPPIYKNHPPGAWGQRLGGGTWGRCLGAVPRGRCLVGGNKSR